ncbi:O-antigen ligase family protein [Buttiauxella ferragutiae]|uniref:O-antigen ligase family protein n=1 Tax=Buttiauxella ferragutiae TaxID=82989 RepID=UPI003525B842
MINKIHFTQTAINKYLFISVVVLLSLVLPTAFLHEKTGRVIFYYCSYLSILGIIVNYKKIACVISNAKIALPFLLLGIVFALWSTISHFQLQENESKELLFTPGKRMFLSSMIALYVIAMFKSEIIDNALLKKLFLFSFSCAFISASFSGIIQSVLSPDRILLGINRATLTAYAYSALSIALTCIIGRVIDGKLKYPLLLVSIIASVYVIFLTETRSAMVIHSGLSLVVFSYIMWADRKIKIIYVALAVGALIAVSSINSKIIETRFKDTTSDITAYRQGNDQTSLGARFSMWKVGIVSFYDHPFGATQNTRNHYIRDYLVKNHQENSAVFQYLDVHLHNEIIQYSSLFGIIGVLVLLYFYISMIFTNGISGILCNPISMVVISTLLYGMTDVLLTSIEFIVIISTLITMAYVICYEKENK